MSDIEETLRDYLLNGIAADIFRAEQAYSLAEVVGRRADQINAATFGDALGPLQEILSEHQTLAITKAFEQPSSRYPTRSIPAVLKLLEAHAGSWKMPHRSSLQEFLITNGYSEEDISSRDGATLTQAVVRHFRSGLPSRERVQQCTLSSSLELLRQSRDKAIAHNEGGGSDSRQRATWGQATALVEHAKHFVGVIGFGYLGIAFDADGDYFLSYDALRASRALNRLLKAAGP